MPGIGHVDNGGHRGKNAWKTMDETNAAAAPSRAKGCRDDRPADYQRLPRRAALEKALRATCAWAHRMRPEREVAGAATSAHPQATGPSNEN
eukprot:CAMPEP_0170408926 /NCGR_PEP_ID=MMETSP0117_2-20130122/29061_1 /TAXON_ID=400756 /ORGANISM="Durinskia baltica, Strain CSIRO CS-38" /LENGTH=91 /DNA_ID=CAMNT_0010666313 /DNA_START=216 /DNA_END=492 /DNA_ORIENTATION=+